VVTQSITHEAAFNVGGYNLWPLEFAHLNPVDSVAFSLRGAFPWRRVPGYIIAQLIGATLAAWLLQAVIKVSATYGSNYPAASYSAGSAFLMEGVLTFGLICVILGTSSGAQNVGLFGSLGVGSYIALAALWGSPISGASMNPARTFGTDFVAATSPAFGSTSRAHWPARYRQSEWHGCCEGRGEAVSDRSPPRARSSRSSSIPTGPEEIRLTTSQQG
jgi:glycerol uptake facilitator-like aquaporin